MGIQCPICKRSIHEIVKPDFCPYCRLYIGPPRPFRIEAEDFLAPGDREATEHLREIPFLEQIVSKALTTLQKPFVWSKLLGRCSELDFKHPLWHLTMEIAGRLCLDKAPRIFICRNGEPASTIGSKGDPSIIIGESTLKTVGEDELKAILAHEIAHIKAGHTEYFTLLRLILEGFLTAIGGSLVIDLLANLLLNKWRRTAELSADRGSVIAIGDASPMKTALLGLHGYDASNRDLRLEDPGSLEKIINSLETHPNIKERIKALDAFYGSTEYDEVRKKIEKNEQLRKIFNGTSH